MNTSHQVVKLAVISRVCMLVLGLALSLFPDYDTSLTPSHFPRASFVTRFLRPFAAWDGEYFTGIAERGYVYEHFHAFFPLYPLLIRALSLFSFGLFSHLVSALIISNISFVIAALSLHHLTLSLFPADQKLAWWTVVLFCINPASIFMSAAYSESLYCALTFSALFFLHRRSQITIFPAIVLFTLATFTRSNGVLSCWFLLYAACQDSIKRRSSDIRLAFSTAFGCVSVAAPFVLVQLYGQSIFHPSDVGPLQFYGYVQSHYWNQGFMNYWQLKQLPNFILAAPILIISAFTGFSCLLSCIQRRQLIPEFPFVAHLGVMCVASLFFMHTQVATRFICAASPAIYWTSSRLLQRGKWIILAYFLSYFLLGPLLFTNFFPWT